MPHLTLEHTNNLPGFPAASALRELNDALIASGYFEEADIKSRVYRLDTFLVGASPNARGFVHVRLSILSGRSDETKRALSGSLLQVLKDRCAPTESVQVQLSVEVQEIERGSYAKVAVAAA
jgi:5-carboxymethyl-2-hydroxymuconate isomerase